MAKTWFLDVIGKAIAKSRVREMCGLMELSERDTRLVLERFCERRGLGPCSAFYPADQQKERLPDLDCQAEGWVEAHINFFTPRERRGIYSYLINGKPRRDRDWQDGE